MIDLTPRKMNLDELAAGERMRIVNSKRHTPSTGFAVFFGLLCAFVVIGETHRKLLDAVLHFAGIAIGIILLCVVCHYFFRIFKYVKKMHSK